MLESIPLYPLAPTVFLVAAGLFALQMARHLRVFAGARPTTVTDAPEARFGAMVRYAIVQVRMFADPTAGVLHAIIFWGFVILTIGTVDRIFFGIVHTIASGILDGWPWRLILLAQNVVAVGVLVAVAVAFLRRVIVRPRRMTLSRDGLLILVLIGGVVLSELLFETFRIAREGDPDASWAFAANALASLASPAAATPLDIAWAVAFWANVLLVSFFLAYLPR